MNGDAFSKSGEVLKVDDELGVVYGWAAICTENGDPYYDTQGDHITEKAAHEACLDFMLSSRQSTDMHNADDGAVPFLMPITKDVGDAMGFGSKRTGIAIGMYPSAEVLAKFKSGEYKGFSIGGTRVSETVITKFAKREQRKAFRQGRRRDMTRFVLKEIAAVDAGAQEGAGPVLFKRADAISKDEGDTFSDARWLVGADLSKISAARKAAPEGDTMATDAEMTKRIDRLEKLAAMNDAAKAHLETLEGKAADAFIGKSATDQAAEIAAVIEKRNATDPVVYTSTDGLEIRKSAGDVAVALAKRLDASNTKITALEASAADASYRKRAESELAFLPGTPEELAPGLAALDSLPEAVRGPFLKALKAGDSAMRASFDSVGHRLEPEARSAEDAIAKRATEIRTAAPTITKAAARVQAEDELGAEAAELYKVRPSSAS